MPINHLGAHIIFRRDGCFTFGINRDNSISYSKQGVQAIGTSSQSFNDEWTLLTITRNLNIFSLYKNGILDKSIVSSIQISDLVGDQLKIGFATGSGGNNGSYWFNGQLDDIRIYNRALTQEEITYLANN